MVVLYLDPAVLQSEQGELARFRWVLIVLPTGLWDVLSNSLDPCTVVDCMRTLLFILMPY